MKKCTICMRCCGTGKIHFGGSFAGPIHTVDCQHCWGYGDTAIRDKALAEAKKQTKAAV